MLYCRCILLMLLHVLVVEARVNLIINREGMVFNVILIKITLWKVFYLLTLWWEVDVVITMSWHVHIRVAITGSQPIYNLLFVHFELQVFESNRKLRHDLSLWKHGQDEVIICSIIILFTCGSSSCRRLREWFAKSVVEDAIKKLHRIQIPVLLPNYRRISLA